MVCAFFGHSDTSEQVYPILRKTIEGLIVKRNVHEFLVGSHGSFDSMVLRTLREFKKQYSHISYNVVLAYMPEGRQEYELYFSPLAKLPVQTVAVCGYLEPLSAVVFAALLLGEKMTIIQIVGAVCIIGGAMIGELVNSKTTNPRTSDRSDNVLKYTDKNM